MKKIFFVIIILLACSEKREAGVKSITYYLTNDSSKYWNKIYQTSEYVKGDEIYPIYRYYFNASGQWRSEVILADTILNLLVGTDMIFPQRWYYMDDSTLNIGSYQVHILKLTEDTFKFINLITTDTLLFRSSIGDTSYNNRAIVDSIISVLKIIKGEQKQVILMTLPDSVKTKK